MHPAPNHLDKLSTAELRDYRHELRTTLIELRAANPEHHWVWCVERLVAIDAILTARAAAPTVIPGVVAGGAVVHALRKVGSYPSGTPKYAKRCGGAGRDNHDPMAAAAGTPVTCKRCLAKMGVTS